MDICGEWFMWERGVERRCRRRRGHAGDCSLTPDEPDPLDNITAPHAKNVDPETSHDAAARLSTAKAMCMQLLRAYANAHPRALTDDEACLAAGLPMTAQKRCSDLRSLLFTEWVRHADTGKQVKVPGDEGRDVGISIITEQGQRELRLHGPQWER
jgi:hypothetical protein